MEFGGLKLGKSSGDGDIIIQNKDYILTKLNSPIALKTTWSASKK